MTTVVHARADFLAAREAMTETIGTAGSVGVVMTMGALHSGHHALIAKARAECDQVIVTVFVNPLQFGPNEDFDRYPRTLDADVALCTDAGADLVWAPAVEDVYPNGPAQVLVDPGALGTILDGASRPGHFAGMLTVVLKLLILTRPRRGYFGEKDYQQLTLITAMAQTFDLGVEIRGVSTVREPDGLAMSSRNRYLDADERSTALALSMALRAGAAAAGNGSAAVLAAANAVLRKASGVDVDYLALRSVGLGEPRTGDPARLLVAARVGRTRLIDNIAVPLLGSGDERKPSGATTTETTASTTGEEST